MRNVRLLGLLALFAFPILGVAQGEANWWFFGDGGGLDFTGGTPTATAAALNTIDTNEGCSAISDECGDLQFYSDGTTIWNRNHTVMLNGTGLSGNGSSTQSGVIVRRPGSTTEYYVFSVFNSMVYSLVDMTLDGGLGGVVPGQKNITVNNNTTERVTLLAGDDQTFYWLLTVPSGQDAIYAYRVDATGVNTTPVISNFTQNINSTVRGYLKASPIGNRLGLCNMTGGAWILSFNKATGQALNPQQLAAPPGHNNPYGVEFSVNSRKMYVSWHSSNGGNGLSGTRATVQYDLLTGPNFVNNPFVLHTTTNTVRRTGLQLGPDGKIYVSEGRNSFTNNFLSTIDNPNDAGAAANFNYNSVQLANGTEAQEGLPQFITNLFDASLPTTFACDGDSIIFSALLSNASFACLNYEWDFGDGSPVSNLPEPTHTYATFGSYVKTLTLTSALGQVYVKTGLVVVSEIPTIDLNGQLPAQLDLCDDDGDGQYTIDLDGTFQAPAIDSQNPSFFNVAYYLTSADAAAGTNQINGNYVFPVGTTTLYIQVENLQNTECTSQLRQVDIVISESPVAGATTALFACDDVSADGLESFDLTNAFAEAYNGQSTTTFSASLHFSQASADANTGVIATPAAPVANLQTNTYVIRLQNPANPDCYDTVELMVEVFGPVTADPPGDLIECDDNGTGVASFDLTGAEPAILNGQNPAERVITYYLTQADAMAGTNPIATPTAYTNTSNPQDIFVRVTNLDGSCEAFTQFALTVENIALNDPIQAYEACDDNGDGVETFDLDAYASVVTTFNPSTLNYSYHLTQADAISGANPLGSSFTNTTNPQTIWVNISLQSNPTCSDVGMLDLVVNPVITATMPTDVELCDIGNNGFEQFDLNALVPGIEGGQTNVGTTFHLTQADADAGSNAIATPGSFPVSDGQVVYVRVTDNATGCAGLTTINFDVDSVPVANSASDFSLCDDSSSDGFEQFDLGTQTAAILMGQPNAVVTYHATQADADAGINELNTLYNNTSNPQTIYVRVENPNNDTCADTTESFVISVDPFLDALVAPDDITLCDDNNPGDLQEVFDLTPAFDQIAGPTPSTDLNVNFYLTQSDAENDVNQIPDITMYTNTASPQTIWARIGDENTGCVNATVNFDLIVEPLPVLVSPVTVDACDDNTPDGFTSFDLVDATTTIENGAANLSTTFYLTQADADAGINGLITPYTNTSNPQTLYARSVTAAGCFSTTSFDLLVVQAPIANAPMTFELCDDNNSGDLTEVFDLTTQDAAVVNGQAGATVTYYNSQADADAGTNAIATPGSYSNVTPTETIYVRIENSTGCFNTNSFDIVVNPVPVVGTTTDYRLCDAGNDGTEDYDLTLQNAAIINGQPDAAVTYYPSLADAQADTNAIANDTAFSNSAAQATVFFRLSFVTTGCFTTGQYDLFLDESPEQNLAAGTVLELCDDASGDGVETFDLSQIDALVLGTQSAAQFTVSYYATQLDADSGTNALGTSYDNTSSPQTIYVRYENVDNDNCVDTTQTFDLIVNPYIDAAAPPVDLELCDDNNAGDESETFDLSVNDATITGAQDFSQVTIAYFTSQADADANANAIATPAAFDNTSNPQTIYVRLTDNVTQCFNATLSFTLTVNELPQIVAPTTVEICDDNTPDGFASFDLSATTTELTQGDTNISVDYYTSQADAQADVNTIADATNFTNTSNPQTLFVRATTTSGCVDFTSVDLEVIAAPIAATAPDQELCDDNAPGDLSESFDLTLDEATIVNGQMGVTVSYYNSQADADADTNAIANATSYNNATQSEVIYVRVENATGCFNTSSFVIRVNELPPSALLPEYLLCIDENGNVVTNSDSPPTLDTGLSTPAYDFVWSLDGVIIAGADQGSYVATAIGNYDVLVTNTATGCEIIDSTTVSPRGVPDAFDVVVTTDPFDNSHQIVATASGPNSTYWFSLDGGQFIQSGVFDNVQPGPHVITIQDIAGCASIDVTVDVFGAPAYFTPNADGFHDTWNIVGLNSDPGTKIYIFDRFGKLLKQLDPNGPGWDGTFNGQPLPSADYWYNIEYVLDGQPGMASGHFTLKR